MTQNANNEVDQKILQILAETDADDTVLDAVPAAIPGETTVKVERRAGADLGDFSDEAPTVVPTGDE